MINPTLVFKILGERKTFIENHPDFVAFILETFKEDNSEGTEIEVTIKRMNSKQTSSHLTVKKSDEKILHDIKSLFEQITE